MAHETQIEYIMRGIIYIVLLSTAVLIALNIIATFCEAIICFVYDWIQRRKK